MLLTIAPRLRDPTPGSAAWRRNFGFLPTMMTATHEPTAASLGAEPSATTRYALAREGQLPDEAPRELLAEPQTIGAGPRCSLRLDGPGLRPLHCVVTVTDAGPVARRWADGTLLNGATFTEAALTLGDVLSVGPVELKVVELPGADAPSHEEVSTPAEEDAAHTEVKPEATPDGWLAIEADEVASPEAAVEDADEVDAIEASVEEPHDGEVDEWYVQPVEEVQEPQSESVELQPATVADDPAIPGHLLAEWRPNDKAEAPSTQLDTPEAAAPFESEWAIEATDEPVSADSVEVELLAAQPEPSQDSNESRLPAAADAEEGWGDWSLATEQESERAAEPTLSAAVDQSESVDGFVHVDRLRQRLAGRRQLVGRLVESLRAERLDRQAACDFLAERDTQLAELSKSVEQIAAAHEAAQAELTQFGEVAEQLAQAEKELAEARAEIADKSESLETLETRLQELEEATPEPTTAGAPEEIEVAPVEEAAPSVELDETVEPMESDDAESVVDLPLDRPAPVETVAEQDTTADEPSTPEGDLWGIERLAPQEETSPAASLWGEPVAEADDPTESAAEPLTAASLPETHLSEPSESLQETSEAQRLVEAAQELLARDFADEEPTLTESEATADDPSVDAPVAPAPIPTGAFEPQPREVQDEEPAGSFIDRYAHMLPDDDEPIEASEPRIEQSIEPLPTADEQAGDGQEDDSIDDYMQKLMQRMRGESDAPAATAVAEPKVAAEAKVVRDAEPTVEVEEQPATVAPIRDLNELKSSSPAIQPTTDMGALRQLANQSARHAIDVAETREDREQASLRLIASVAALGGGAFACITATSVLGVQFLGGAAGVAIGAFFGMKTLRSCQVTPLPKEIAPPSED